MNGSYVTYTKSDHSSSSDMDTVTSTVQYKLNAGDTVNVRLDGYYFEPNDSIYAHFEGHLISETNE